MKHSKHKTLNWHDIANSMLMLIGTSILAGIAGSLNQGVLPNTEQLGSYIALGLSAGITYLIKQWNTNTDGSVFKKEANSDFKDRV